MNLYLISGIIQMLLGLALIIISIYFFIAQNKGLSQVNKKEVKKIMPIEDYLEHKIGSGTDYSPTVNFLNFIIDNLNRTNKSINKTSGIVTAISGCIALISGITLLIFNLN